MRFAALLLVIVPITAAQTPLQQQIRTIAAGAGGKVSVACALPGSSLNCDLNPAAHPPMQSVFKFPLAITFLHQIEQGKFSLDQPVHFLKEDLILPKPYSPLQDKYPNAGVDVPLRTLLQMAVGLSDNTATDILLRLLGGTKPVSDYISSLGVQGLHLLDSERALHQKLQRQYRNWFEPRAAVQLLRLLSDRSPLNTENTKL